MIRKHVTRTRSKHIIIPILLLEVLHSQHSLIALVFFANLFKQKKTIQTQFIIIIIKRKTMAKNKINLENYYCLNEE